MTQVRFKAPPILNEESGRPLCRSLRKRKWKAGESAVIDLSGTESMDTLGGAWLVEIATHLRKHQVSLSWENASGQVAEYMEIVAPSLHTTPLKAEKEWRILEHFFDTAINIHKESKEFFSLFVDTVYWTLMAPFEGRGFRFGLLIDEIHEMGVRAIRIVFLMNFLLGVIIAMLSAAQVQSFGLAIYVADLLMIGFSRELAVIMTATVVSARTGAAIAAEISTMKVQEEIDALRGMGLNVTQFLVAPKLVALVICLPCLTGLGMIAGLLGGAFWGVFALDFRPFIWWTQTLNAAYMGDISQGMLKALVFAVAITLIGCHNGLRVSGGSRGVGLMTTRAVVQDIFMMICVDITFAAVFYYVMGGI